MHARVWWPGLLFLWLVFLAPPRAVAQPVDPETRQLFDEGLELLQNGRFSDARERFARAAVRHETAAVVLNLGLAERGMGLQVEAAAHLERYLTLGAGRISPERRAEVEAILREVRAAIARVTVHLAVMGAEVTVNGQRLPQEQLSLELPMNPGRVVFRASGPELRDDERVVDLAPGARVRVNLSPRALYVTGTLRVEPSSPEASIWIDGQRAGTGLFESDLRPGRHVVAVRAQGFPPYETAVWIRAGRVEDLRVRLSHETSILNRWWFWAGVVGVAALTTALVIGFTSGTEPVDGGSLGLVIQAVEAP